MSTLTLHINGRDYQIACDDGQEAHLSTLAHEINERMDVLGHKLGRAPENLHFVLTMLMLADELSDAKADITRLRRELQTADGSGDSAQWLEQEAEIARQMETITTRLETLAKKSKSA